MVSVWRNDDINPNSNFELTKNIYGVIREFYPTTPIWSCVNIFSRYNEVGSLYKEVPFKKKPLDWFYDVDRIMPLEWVEKYRDISEIVSHGLFHIDHTQVSRDTQVMSILSSCKLLGTDIFVPPFNAFNADTEAICNENGINLVTQRDNWLSIDNTPFNKNHELWYMHSWRWNPTAIRKALGVS